MAGTVELLDWWLLEEPEREPEEVAALLDGLVMDIFSAGAAAPKR